MFDREDPRRIVNFRPLLFAAVGMILGIAAFEGYRTLDLSHALSAAVPAVVTVLLCVLCIYSVMTRKWAYVILIVFFLTGALRTALAQPEHIVEAEYLVTGTVDEISETKEGVIFLRGVRLDDESIGGRLKVTVKCDCDDILIGDVIAFKGVVKLPSIRFDSYDERLTLLSSGVTAKTICFEYRSLGSGRLPVKKVLNGTRSYLHERIDMIFSENADIVSGFLLGMKSGIDEADIDSFRATGTAHLLTLSGFHVSLIASLLMLVFSKRFPVLRLCFICAFLILYCGIADFAPSIVRASIMCGCMLLSDAAQRRRDTLSSLSLAALIILTVSPYMLYSVGFKLSFAATLGIVLFNSAGRLGSRKPILNRFFSAATMTLGATAATMLISAQSFRIFPTYGLIANIIAVPLFSAAIMMCFVLLLFGMIFPEAAAIAAWAPNRLIDGTMTILNWIKSLPYSEIEVIPPSTLTGVLMLAIMFCISAYILRPVRKRLSITSLVFLLFTASLAADIIRA